MALGIAAAACFVIAAGLLLAAHLARTGLSPVRDAVSDYGTTHVHQLYRAMVVALGVGGILLALGLARDTDAGSLGWLWAYGLSRIAIAGFMTDRDPPPFTTEGRIHWLLAAVASPRSRWGRPTSTGPARPTGRRRSASSWPSRRSRRSSHASCRRCERCSAWRSA